MPELTPKQLKNLERLARVVDGGNVGVLEHLIELEDELSAKIDRVEAAIPDLDTVAEKMKGVDGKDGVAGPQGAKGDKGDRGEPGQGVQGAQGKPGKDGRDGRDGRDAIDGMDGKDGLNGSPDTAEDIRNKLELLDGEDRLDAKYIKNLPEAVQHTERVIGANRALYQLLDVDMSGLAAGQSIKWDGTRWLPYTPSGGGSSTWYVGEHVTLAGDGKTLTLLHAPTSVISLTVDRQPQINGLDYTGTIDGTNKTFAFGTAIDPSLLTLIYADYS